MGLYLVAHRCELFRVTRIQKIYHVQRSKVHATLQQRCQNFMKQPGFYLQRVYRSCIILCTWIHIGIPSPRLLVKECRRNVSFWLVMAVLRCLPLMHRFYYLFVIFSNNVQYQRGHCLFISASSLERRCVWCGGPAVIRQIWRKRWWLHYCWRFIVTGIKLLNNYLYDNRAVPIEHKYAGEKRQILSHV